MYHLPPPPPLSLIIKEKRKFLTQVYVHAVYEGVEKEAEDDPDQHQSGLDQQPPVGDVILQQQHHFSDIVNHALEWETFASVTRDILSGFFIHEKKNEKTYTLILLL